MAEPREHEFQTRQDLANEYRRMLKNARLKPSQKLQIGKALADIEGWKVVPNETDFEHMSDDELLQQVLQIVVPALETYTDEFDRPASSEPHFAVEQGGAVEEPDPSKADSPDLPGSDEAEESPGS